MLSTGAQARFQAVNKVGERSPKFFDALLGEDGERLKISEVYGMNTFSRTKMKEKLPNDIYRRLIKTIETDQKLDKEVANAVAHAVKEWSLAEGVTHFCHWFQPQTGLTAEKHDSFLELDRDGNAMERFSGVQLIQSEPDASSLPSGGMRTTFEARGYTAWDPSSPMFIMEIAGGSKTLCIPSVFISYHGSALDEKTGLLRSMEVLTRKAKELLTLIEGEGNRRVIPTLGVEQEYFLVDHAFYQLRPDLVMSNRTLLGAAPAKGQQLEDHYFGSIPPRVRAFMNEAEYELYKLGVPVKTRHNEVAPSQFEVAAIFEEANVATDHNHLIMETLKRVARQHNYEALFHEKPFAELNGSGKHCNWSLAVSTIGSESSPENLLDPGKTPHENLRFLLFLMSTLKGVHRHAGILRAGIASHGNDHRLGANEAPPAIISVFLGELLTRVLDEIEKGNPKSGEGSKAVTELGVANLPRILRDNTDRNRTSPFAFTGNKFEFRAVGSSASVAFPVTMLNAAVADGLADVTAALKKRLDAGESKDVAILAVLKETVIETKSIRFEGNNYSEEWIREAEKRGLPHLRKTPESLEALTSEQAMSMISEMGVFSKEELTSRFNVRTERYVNHLLIEVHALREMVDTQILPAVYSFYGDLAQGVTNAQAAGTTAPQNQVLKQLSEMISSLQAKRSSLESEISQLEKLEEDIDKAHLLAKEIIPTMEDLRSVCDRLEGMVADDYWPLPKYREMLFLS
jgi:glutamine synthetase